VNGDFQTSRLELFGTKKKLVVSIARLADLTAGIEKRLEEAWAANTWRNYGSTWNQCQHFVSQLPSDIPLTVAVMMFLEESMNPGPENHDWKPISVSSAHVYARRLSSIYHLKGVPLPDLRWYRRALMRQGALRPENQAPPATVEDVRAAMGPLPRRKAVALWLMWVTCSRADDMSVLRRIDVVFVRIDPDQMRIYDINFSGTKGDPFHLGNTVRVALGPVEALSLELHLATLSPDQPFTDLKWTEVNNALKRVRPELSAHSIKRGALLVLLMQGVPLDTIRVMAKHAGLQQLLAYLPPGAVAERFGTAVAARWLC